ncbi:glutamate receptor ionotropic, kainate 1-like [Thrips palmi]|uniref:Glutamate receptor ionotropic, kainate 1-like n=1 Tax=Thrips palmi TaxID=161013 RepID=A0A6P8Z8M4_THRPL|nr:glutamate receptor ionotropic, kainate 1-like [Thrips palmi]
MECPLLVVAVLAVLAVAREAGAYYEQQEEIRIGGLFLTTEEDCVSAFYAAIDAVNEDKDVLPDHRLVGVDVAVPEFDALEAHKRVCELLAGGVAAVLGPSSGVPATHKAVQLRAFA